MSWLSNAFGGNRDPNKDANQYIDQIPGAVKPYYDPYMNAGKDSLDKLKTHYSDLTDNPGDVYNKLGAGYKQSPGYEAALRQAMAGANNAASMGHGGSLGSYGHTQLAAGAAGDVASKDYENYINHILGLYTQGMEGEQGLETQGYNANKDYADMIASYYNTKGTNAANATSAQNQQHGQNWGNLWGTLGTIGAGIAGGPVGTAAGNWLSNYLGNNKEDH